MSEMAKARADQAELRAQLDVEFQTATAAHPAAVTAWEAERESPDGRARHARRRLVVRDLPWAVGWLLLAIVLAIF